MSREMEAGRIWGRGVEWDAVRRLLSQQAHTPLGRDRALAAHPSPDARAVEDAIELTSQARAALGRSGPPPLDTAGDVRDVLDRARLPGSTLFGPELAELLPFLSCLPRVATWARAAQPVAPGVADLARRLPNLGDLARALGGALEDDGSLRDEASPRLRQLRRDLRDRRRRLVADLERLWQAPDADRIFADRYVTLRHGRYVVPVRAEARLRLRGIVHDRSQSGQTLFVEPEGAVEANNELVQLAREEEHEAARILTELTAAVRARLQDLDVCVAVLGDLDALFARARLAERLRATAPIITGERRLRIRAARHPLLVAQRWPAGDEAAQDVVPIDIELDADRPLLVVTGPNAGGKTVALKTLALHVLLAQIGCHIPADEGSELPVFERLFAIVGDDQSVAENLSTFSAFVRQVREILAEADDRSLVLLDELGAGTDPEEGAALAQAILETLAERGALVMATTHLEPLKAFASTHPRARNASVEFDAATLGPTFRLRYDRPGQSYALTIAARLGLPADLIRRAEGHRSHHAARLAELLQRLDDSARAEADRTRAIERRERDAAACLAAAREAEATALARARDIVERARQEAAAMVAEVRRAVSAELERLKRGERSRRDLVEARRRVGQTLAKLAPAAAEPSPAEREALVPGALVVAEHLGLRGRLVALAGPSATVEAGAMTVRVPLSALRPAGPAATGSAANRESEAARRRSGSGAAVHAAAGAGGGDERSPAVPAELMLLGKRTDEARDLLEQYLDRAFMAGLARVRLVHGKGTGALRKTVRDLLAAHPLVASYRDGEPSEGGAGATVAALKVS
jgi:DNA mismatch repair protein MutS2